MTEPTKTPAAPKQDEMPFAIVAGEIDAEQRQHEAAHVRRGRAHGAGRAALRVAER